jgi:hypothetical protein
MLRVSTLLPALVLAFGLASSGVAMAGDPAVNSPLPKHTTHKAAQTAEESFAMTRSANVSGTATSDQTKEDTTQAASGCDSAPRYLEPAYCGPNHGH